MERIKISPYARKCAREADIDFTGLTGTGPGGRIVKRDIDAEIQRLAQQLPAGRNLGIMTMEADIEALTDLLKKLPKNAKAPKLGDLLDRAIRSAGAEKEVTVAVTDLTEFAVELFLPEVPADCAAAVGLCDLEEDEVRLVLCYDRNTLTGRDAAELLTLACDRCAQPLLLLV